MNQQVSCRSAAYHHRLRSPWHPLFGTHNRHYRAICSGHADRPLSTEVPAVSTPFMIRSASEVLFPFLRGLPSRTVTFFDLGFRGINEPPVYIQFQCVFRQSFGLMYLSPTTLMLPISLILTLSLPGRPARRLQMDALALLTWYDFISVLLGNDSPPGHRLMPQVRAAFWPVSLWSRLLCFYFLATAQ